MSDTGQLMQFVSSPAAIVAAAALLFWVLVAVLLFKYLKRTADARLLKKIFARHCQAIEMDAVFPDGLDGFMFVDYLLLLQGRIVALKTLSKKGVVLGMPDGDEWTCIENNRSSKFPNPLLGLKQSVDQMRHILDYKGIDALVLFGSQSEFPKGITDGALQLADLDKDLSLRKGSESEHARAKDVWDKLIDLNHQARKELNHQLAS